MMLSGTPEVGGAGAQHVFEEGRPLWLEQHAGEWPSPTKRGQWGHEGPWGPQQ